MRPCDKKYKMHFGFGEFYPPELRYLTHDQKHHGQDYSCPKGSRIFASVDGKLLAKEFRRGYGFCVIIGFHQGFILKTQYRLILAHLERFLTKRCVGEKIGKHEVVGLSGNSGMSTGPHLHAEVQVKTKNGWVACDPAFAIGNT